MKLTLVVFGISSNLSQIKLIPALYDLAKHNLLPSDFRLIGSARGNLTRKKFQDYVYWVLTTENRHHRHAIDDKVYRKLVDRISYLRGDIADPKFFQNLKKEVGGGNKMFYLATYPELYETIFRQLKKFGLSEQGKEWSRVLIEKPLGTDLASAKSLNKLLLRYFTEDQIYRLDHYLGKVTMQNILNFRFGNEIFEPLMNKDYVDCIQVTASEDFGIGQRGGYYDKVGALKDVGQNHLIQMLALATMDQPKSYSNSDITHERVKLINSLKPQTNATVFGQYEGYRKEARVSRESSTDTFFATKTYIDNSRFRGVPIYLRAGKKLKTTTTEIVVVFKSSTGRILNNIGTNKIANELVYRIQPDEGVAIKILVNDPGHSRTVRPTYMQFSYRHMTDELTDPYEKLLYDAIQADQTFFNDAPEVEAQWRFIDPLFISRGKPFIYKSGTWGPREADKLVQKDNRNWVETPIEFVNSSKAYTA